MLFCDKTFCHQTFCHKKFCHQTFCHKKLCHKKFSIQGFTIKSLRKKFCHKNFRHINIYLTEICHTNFWHPLSPAFQISPLQHLVTEMFGNLEGNLHWNTPNVHFADSFPKFSPTSVALILRQFSTHGQKCSP